jgi:hypothetical protein
MTSEANVVMNENCPKMTNGNPGRRPQTKDPLHLRCAFAMALANTRIEMPRIAPGMIKGSNISM